MKEDSSKYKRPPEIFEHYVKRTLREFEQEITKVAEEGAEKGENKEIVKWILKEDLLNLTYEKLKTLLGEDLAPQEVERKWRKRAEKLLVGRKWRKIKSSFWKRWTEVVAKNLSSERDIIGPLKAYAEKVLEGEFKRREMQKRSLSASYMFSKLLQERGRKTRGKGFFQKEGRESLKYRVGGVPRHYLFMVFSPASLDLEKLGREGKKEYLKSKLLKRDLLDLCEKMKVTCRKSWTKGEILDTMLQRGLTIKEAEKYKRGFTSF